MKKYILLNLTALFTLFLAACMFISCGTSKKKANRIKCASNVNQITKSFVSSSDYYDGLFPWQLLGEDKEALYGDVDLKHLGTIFALEEVRDSLGSPKVLLSPCDPIRKRDNDKASIAGYESYDARKGKPVPHGAISYGICLGADGQLPETILCITRNVPSGDLKGAKFLGNVMSGLKAHQGQMSTSDGSVMQVGDLEDFARSITVHTKAKGGNALGPPSTKLMLPK